MDHLHCSHPTEVAADSASCDGSRSSGDGVLARSLMTGVSTQAGRLSPLP